jgi:putative redox protein
MATQEIQISWKSGVAFEAHQNGKMFMIDGSPDVGGQDLGVRPKALILSALAGCTGIDVVMILNKMRVVFSHFDIKVQGTLTNAEPTYYDQVKIIYEIKLADKADGDKVKKAVELSQEKYCGVSEMVRKFAELSYEIVYL